MYVCMYVNRVTYFTADHRRKRKPRTVDFPFFDMTMADDDHFCGEIVSKFLLNTCIGQHPWLNHQTIMGMVICVTPVDDDEVAVIPVLTGSTAELYIQPMLSCVGDIDIMYHRIDELPIPEGTAPPTHLPAEFRSRVNVFDILDSDFPGYVYLQTCYLLTECTDDNRYNAVRCKKKTTSLSL